MKKISLLLGILFLCLNLTMAQTEVQEYAEEEFLPEKTEAQVKKTDISQPDKTGISEYTTSSVEFMLSLVVLGFGLIALFLEVWLIKTGQIGEDNIVKFFVVTLIITATLFLITAGYDNDQIAPAMGLLGTIAGYLLGKAQGKKEENKVEENKAEENK